MSGQFINHFNAVRFRITGSGSLRSRLISLGTEEVSLPNLAMSSSTNKFPTVNTSFLQSKAQLEIKTTEIDEVFLIKEIHIYIKPTFTSSPQ